jgi:ABC-type hemin transport system ATPase subunit
VIAVFQDLNLASAYSQEIVMIKFGSGGGLRPHGRCDDPGKPETVFDIQAKVAVDDFTGKLQVRYKRK